MWRLLLSASPLGLAVLVLLLGLSVLTWAILFFKWGSFRKYREMTENFLDLFWSGKEIALIYSESKKYSLSPVAKVFQAGYVELQRILEKRNRADAPLSKELPESMLSNVDRAVARAERLEGLHLEASLTFLATTGSTAPFIGLLGTVWGIITAFQNIGLAGAASIATVAPGIAEALVATAVGLFAAIPAVMGYNFFIHQVRAFRTEMENFSSDLLNIVKRNYFSV